jgi:signal transduction histidine kinase
VIPGASTINKFVNSRLGEAPAVYRRWAVIYVFMVTLGLLGDVASCSSALLPVFWAQILPHLPYIGIMFAAIRLGAVAGLVAACIAGVLHLTMLAVTCGGASSQGGHLFMFAAVGLAAGWISQRQVAVPLNAAGSTALEGARQRRKVSLTDVGRMMPELVHQFRTPIASIEGAGFVLGDTDLPDEKRREFVGIIRKECRRLELLVGLLDFTQSHSSDNQEVNVARLLDEVIHVCRAKTDARIAFRNSAPRDSLRLRCDPELIKQAAQIVITNAINTIPGKGNVELCADSVPGEIAIRIDVHAERVYPASAAQASNSHGIDLAVVQEIISRCGGAVRVEPGAPGGTSISMILPDESWVSA